MSDIRSNPEWYSRLKDDYINTAKELDNADKLINEGYMVPDADGAKSSDVRDQAIVNNTFSQQASVESLRDIYLNSFYKLTASNNDNVHFYKWEGRMSDFTFSTDGTTCEFRIPWDVFISHEDRSRFKMSQYYRKWIKVENILNNWDVFHWHLMVFVNQRIYSEYEIYIQEQEVWIRMPYVNVWRDKDYPVYIYKMDTNFQKRVLVSRELLNNQWEWKMPISYIDDSRITNFDRLIVYVNQISDPEIRTDGVVVNTLSDNLDFIELPTEGSYVDLSLMSQINIDYINSERFQYLWLSIVVPKFMKEYPKLLVTDVLYRPYLPKMYPVKVMKQNMPIDVYADTETGEIINDSTIRQAFVDYNDRYGHEYDGWTNIIRPIILSDSHTNHIEPYDVIRNELDSFRISIDIFSDTRINFQNYISNDPEKDEENWNKWIDLFKNHGQDLYTAQSNFLSKRLCPPIKAIETAWVSFITGIEAIRDAGWQEIYIPYGFYSACDVLVTQCYLLLNRFSIADTIRGIFKKTLWPDREAVEGKVRYTRPVDVSNFLTFEYDTVDMVWRPRPRKITHHFPDVYSIEPLEGETLEPNAVYKAFFFYSDTINPRDITIDQTQSSPAFDEESLQYQDRPGIYKDIFIEKFYWMGLSSVYSGLLLTGSKWEMLEYVINNPSYVRFNKLFLETMEPYFKLGLATYLKGANYNFPFDDAVAKLKEAMKLQQNGYDKIVNFDIYLEKQWIPSYFDYMQKIMDDYEMDRRIVGRPLSTFDVDLVANIYVSTEAQLDKYSAHMLPVQQNMQNYLDSIAINNIVDMTVVDQLMSSIIQSREDIESVGDIIKQCQADYEIYPKKFIERMRDLLMSFKDYVETISRITKMFAGETGNEWLEFVKSKDLILKAIRPMIDETIRSAGNTVYADIGNIDTQILFNVIYDLSSYISGDENDSTIIGQINQFNDAWSESVKVARNKLFLSTTTLAGNIDPDTVFTSETVVSLLLMINEINVDVQIVKSAVLEFWENKELPQDEILLGYIDDASNTINEYIASANTYVQDREAVITLTSVVFDALSGFNGVTLSDRETSWRNDIETQITSYLSVLSYIDISRQQEATSILDEIIDIIIDWGGYLSDEAYIYEDISTLASEIYIALDPGPTEHPRYNNMGWIIDGLVRYIDQNCERYTPDQIPQTYMKVYELNAVDISEPGIFYKDANAYIPRLGVLDITASNDDGKINTAVPTSVIDGTPLYVKTFTDPVRDKEYLIRSANTIGIGGAMLAVDSSEQFIRTNNVAVPTISVIYSSVKSIMTSAGDDNPYSNVNLNYTLREISRAEEKWAHVKASYDGHIDQLIVTAIDDAMIELKSMETLTCEFMISRAKLDVPGLINILQKLVGGMTTYSVTVPWSHPSIPSAITDGTALLNATVSFSGNGVSWHDIDPVLAMFPDIEAMRRLYGDIVGAQPPSKEVDHVNGLLDQLDICLSNMLDGVGQMGIYIPQLTEYQSNILTILDPLDHENILPEEWFTVCNVTIANPGQGYRIGQIVRVRVADNTTNDVFWLCYVIKSLDKYGVASVKPLIDYAMNFRVWGTYETETDMPNGTGLVLDIKSQFAKPNILLTPGGHFVPDADQFDEYELVSYDLQNIYDINLNYELFVGGYQVTDFYQRHEDRNYDKPRKVDTIYVRANLVNNLKNSHLHIDEEQYFIYRIDSIEIDDPGMGYHVDQDIYVDADEYCLKLKVESLRYSPFKEIDQVSLTDGVLVYERHDPAGLGLSIVPDTQNNIDDEFHISRYDTIPRDGNEKPLTFTWPYITFTETRYDSLDGDDRNSVFMYPSVPMTDPQPDPPNNNGDPEFHWYAGSRIENSFTGDVDDRWNGIMNVEEVTDPFIEDYKRQPPNVPKRGEYQLLGRVRFHNSAGSTEPITQGSIVPPPNPDLWVDDISARPQFQPDWEDSTIGSTVGVRTDNTHDGHAWVYTVYGITATGYLHYDAGIPADDIWNRYDIDWMNVDWHPDFPSESARYRSAPWFTAKDYMRIYQGIERNEWLQTNVPTAVNNTTYIHNCSINDISIFNWTTKSWEDLSDSTRWKIEFRNDSVNKDWGFSLEFLHTGEPFSYDMKIYINKTAETHKRNHGLIRDGKLSVYTTIADEVDIPETRIEVNTGRVVRIRKLFPYEQSQTYRLTEKQKAGGMVFTMPPYSHYANEIHLEDIVLYNHTLNRYENVMDPSMFEVWYRDTNKDANINVIGNENIRAVNDDDSTIYPYSDLRAEDEDGRIHPFNNDNSIRVVTGTSEKYEGMEHRTNISSVVITNPGSEYSNGDVWAYADSIGMQIFGTIVTDNGKMVSFTPGHIINIPDDGFYNLAVYQNEFGSGSTVGTIQVQVETRWEELYDDGWIHNVTNYMAVPPVGEFKIIPKYSMIREYEYEISLSKTPRSWRFMDSLWSIKPEYDINGYQIPYDRTYILIDGRRFPVINCSTGKPSWQVDHTSSGTKITFLNLYRPNEQIEVRTLPYPIRSVYVQRNIPKHGYINLEGKLNKPLNRKYYEFWVNGKLLHDEVTIITPTRIFLHGLTSLKNLEIIEVNRDPHEYFSDGFNVVESNALRPYPSWDLQTYLDDALKGTLDGDNYPLDEQAQLLDPVWYQVSRDHPEYMNYPENTDNERDILLRAYLPEDMPLPDLDGLIYQYVILDTPTLEGVPLVGREMPWSLFKWKPISNNELVNLMNDVWAEEIANDPYLNTHVVIEDAQWYGITARLYDEYGVLTHDLNKAVYRVHDRNLINVDVNTGSVNIIKGAIKVDLN